jgi:transcriptional regulator with PAS, ATPase and Fis domain
LAETLDASSERTRSNVWGMVPGTGTRVLVFWEGGATTRDLPEGSTLVLGRALECDVHVGDPSVSRRHVAIHNGPPIQVEDLGGLNGTRISGERLSPRIRFVVSPGAVIEVGSAMVVLQMPAAADAFASAQITDSHPRVETEMQRLDRLVTLVAGSGLSVILLGETGVGKEVIAERMHRISSRSSGPFVRLNCAALPEALLESELFGHEKGAFTGALRTKPGLLEVAAGGSVFLDEVAELSLSTQAKLLRVIEQREVLRVGGLQPRPIDVRFIAATNRDLGMLVERESFRRDLYFRLNGITVSIPPLRERKSEILKLAGCFVERESAKAGRPPPSFSPASVETLLGHPWAGNIRELRNAVERAVVLCQTHTILPEHLVLERETHPRRDVEEPVRNAAALGAHRTLSVELEAFERHRILEALRQAGGNQTRAAVLLGVSRRTLVNRLSEYGLTKECMPRRGER